MREICREHEPKLGNCYAATFEDDHHWYFCLSMFDDPREIAQGMTPRFDLTVVARDSVERSGCSWIQATSDDPRLISITIDEPREPRWSRLMADPLATIMELLL